MLFVSFPFGFLSTFFLEFLQYYLNLKFIQANLGNLPLAYQIAAGFVSFQWWAVCIAGLIGLSCTILVIAAMFMLKRK